MPSRARRWSPATDEDVPEWTCSGEVPVREDRITDEDVEAVARWLDERTIESRPLGRDDLPLRVPLNDRASDLLSAVLGAPDAES